jgi:hypothetical protein
MSTISARLNEDMGLLNDYLTEPTHESSIPLWSWKTIPTLHM